MRILMFIGLLLLPLAAVAQDRARAILVMDGSGSMWGQIDGQAKISIAQGVVGDLLRTLPEQTDLGLTIYGHRRKGDCGDIETVVQPGPGTLGGITDAVNAIKPKGKTPMTEAVRQAALALRYTEEKATVILVSDGIETCDPDPCAAARALEDAGVDFTTHVIGFDVTDTEALRQMQCLADETGGTFRSAANAAELADAMTTVVAAAPEPEPEPQPVTITFNATDGKNGPVIGDALVWDLLQDGAAVTDTQNVGSFSVDLTPGEYRIEVLRPADEATGEAIFGVGQVTKTVTIALPEFRPAATLEAAGTAAAGSTIPVRWGGPNEPNDYIAVSTPGETGYHTYTYTKEGSPLDLQMPAEPGNYELRYVLAKGGKVLATRPIAITDIGATITAEGDLSAGGKATVRWTGPDYQNDYIAVSRPGEKGYETYTYTRNGSPLEVQLPAEPGDYELRYVMNQKARVLTASPITVVAVGATVTPPAKLPAGGTVQISWTGPDNANDYIAIFPPGSKSYTAYSYTRKGSPLDLKLPAAPGPYEIAYVQNQGNTDLVRVPVTVTPVSATVSPRGPLKAGSTAQIDWQGPDDQNDYIAIFPAGSKSYTAYTYTNKGSPLGLKIPSEPGAYELAYVQNVGNTVLFSLPVTVEPVSATVTPPSDLPAGGSVAINWEGPDDQNDYIAIFPRGEKNYLKYTYTNKGNPLQLALPAAPGDYDIGYVQNVGSNILTRVAVTVTPVSASVTAPPETKAGTQVSVSWQGPDDQNDYIAVFPRDSDRYLTYSYTRKGNPLKIKLPAEAGSYDLGYVQNVDNNVLIRVPIEVE